MAYYKVEEVKIM